MPPARSAPAVSLPQRLRRRLRATRWRPVAGLAGGSLVFSLALVGYLFGWGDHFFSRLFTACVVVFGLLTFMFQAAVPFVGWAAVNWFGRGWAGAPPVPRRRAGAGGRPSASAPPRRTGARASAPGSYP